MSEAKAMNNIVKTKAIYKGKEGVFRKLAFASGEITYNFPWMIVSAYLIFFLTDIALVPAAVVSALILGVRIFDAVNDPIIGLMADKTNTRFGRYRPWVFIGGLALGPMVCMLFWAHPQWGVNARVLWICIFYALAVIAATMLNIPYGGLHASITPDPTERASFSGFRLLFSNSACAIASGIFLPLTKRFGAAQGNSVSGYLISTIIVCAIAIPFVFICFLGTKEVVKRPKNQKLVFSSVIKVVTQNPPLWIVTIAFFIFGFFAYGRMSVAMYYFTYVWKDSTLFTLFTSFNGIISGVSAFFGFYVLKILKSKKNTILVGYAGIAILSMIAFLFSPGKGSNPYLLIATLFTSSLFSGLSNCMLYSMIPDTVEYGQWKSGVRTDGFVYSSSSFMLKLGGAISPALMSALLALTGYIPGGAQSEAALKMMNLMMNLIPAVLGGIGFIIFLFYKLDNKLYAQIVSEIAERENMDEE